MIYKCYFLNNTNDFVLFFLETALKRDVFLDCLLNNSSGMNMKELVECTTDMLVAVSMIYLYENSNFVKINCYTYYVCYVTLLCKRLDGNLKNILIPLYFIFI